MSRQQELLPPDLPEGVVHTSLLTADEQQEMVAAIREAEQTSPFFRPRMPRTGKPFSVRMTNFGELGWVSDQEGGYRYQPTHPETGAPWAPIPQSILRVWEIFAGYPAPPQACLVNHYANGARMGQHQDRDEEALDAPVVSISLGDDCRFRIGNTTRGGKTISLRLLSGDVVVLGGPSRLRYHGVDRVFDGTSDLLAGWLPEGGRINLTLRRVTLPG